MTVTIAAPVLVAHPLAETLAAVGGLGDALRPRFGFPDDPRGWVAADDLLGARAGPLDRLLERVGADRRTPYPGIRSSLFLAGYAWQVAGAALGCYLLARRVPSLAAANVLVRFGDDGRAREVAFLDGGFAALPFDPGVDHPDAQVVRDEGALRRHLVAGLLEGHLDDLMDALIARGGLRQEFLRAGLEDRLVGALIWLGKRAGREAEAAAEAEAFAAVAPFAGRSGVLWVEHGGRRECFAARQSCCLTFRLPGRANCATCPLLPVEERRRRLVEHLATPEQEAPAGRR
jgi:hypothetical protein